MTALLLPVAVAQGVAQDRYFCASVDNDWHDGDNWWTNENCSGDNGVPDSDDHAIIKANLTANLSGSATISSMDILSGATVNIGNHSLNLNASGDFIESEIVGTLNLDNAGSLLHIVTNDHTVKGSGSIVGQASGARISMGGNRTLKNQTTIEGVLDITEIIAAFDSFFTNEGTVDANGSGTLSITVDTVTDAASGLWTVSASGGTLQFAPNDTSPSAMEGDFTVSAGTLDIDTPGIDTSGTLTFTGGTIDCAGLTGSETAKFTGS
ncbi:MAG: hypothetical protein IID37_02540 [Planctomycetes bacterium]|nr:hypothetical protein [Planctomycetota bacterium]